MITSQDAPALVEKPSDAYHIQQFAPDELAESPCRAGFTVGPERMFGQHQRIVYKKYVPKANQHFRGQSWCEGIA